ncbi:MAG: ribonuclease E/G [Caulobacter sp.]|nr:ribonuclease E/G [Caulobacter sp.]
MSQRRLYLDRGIGETRGVVTLDGRPERLLIARDGDPPALALGARSVARVRRVEKAFAAAFLDLPGGCEALLPLRADETPPAQGSALEIEIRGEARRDKLATARLIGVADGAPRLLQVAPDLAAELAAVGKDSEFIEGPMARQVADAAEAEVLETIHPLPGGGSIAIEPTRALTAIDVDLGGRGGGDSKRAARQANLTALSEGARLLRLKGLGGLVVFDLVGKGHDARALLEAARTAFAPDNPGVAIDQISRFGTLTLTVPRRRAPVLDVLRDETGDISPLTAALRLARALERQGRLSPGGRLLGRCSPAVLAAFAVLRPALSGRLGARFEIEACEGWSADRLDVQAR